jgi:hypothetical protein
VRRHEFEPGKLIAGLVLLGTGVAYALDATGAWDIPPWVLFPIVSGGLILAALTGLLTRNSRST